MINNLNKVINEMEIKVRAISVNESFIRASIAGFCLQLNPSIDELTDIKTAVSEAVTNSVVHAYPQTEKGEILIKVKLYSNNEVYIQITDFGIGIKNLEEAKKPFYTTKPDQERSGMGFTVMESFMDEVNVSNEQEQGLTVTLVKRIKNENMQTFKAM